LVSRDAITLLNFFFELIATTCDFVQIIVRASFASSFLPPDSSPSLISCAVRPLVGDNSKPVFPAPSSAPLASRELNAFRRIKSLLMISGRRNLAGFVLYKKLGQFRACLRDE
jgi:hypothetical protein